LAMTVKPHPPATRHPPILEGLRDGLRYAFGFPPIRAVLLLMALASLVGMPYATLLPIFAKTILHGDSHTYGFLLGATGVGAVTGAIYLATRTSPVGLGRVIAGGAMVFGIGLIALGTSHMLWLSLVLMVVVGLGMMLQIVSTNTVLQTIVEDDKRGRVMSLYAMAFLGMTPFGSLLAGGLATWIGAPWTVVLGGTACLLGGALFASQLPALRPLVRPIYQQKGILPVPGTPPVS
jgi:MFS family permease